MKQGSKIGLNAEERLEGLYREIKGRYGDGCIEEFAKYFNDPLGFVKDAFTWGKGRLKGETGPDEWQTDILEQIGAQTLTTEEAIQIAVRSGHGIGKTALIAWIILWFMSTRPHPQVIVTANTQAQLTNKTWRELAKWHSLMTVRHYFRWTATKFYHVHYPETWFATAQHWSRERSEAFAGTHEKYVLVIYDEASAIDDVIWEVTEGAMTTPGAIWLAFGNPTRNTGRFSECFKKYRHRWITREIDSRTAKKADSAQIEKWIEDYGLDSDFVRVRVLGQEPRAGAMQFIGNDLVEPALGRALAHHTYHHAPRVLGVDVARFGDDMSVIAKRQGLCTFELLKFRGLDTMALAYKVVNVIRDFKPNGVFIDVGAMGAGVVDRLRQLGLHITEIQFGSKAGDEDHYFNKRAEMWGGVKKWLKDGGALPQDNELRDDLIAPEYGFDQKGRIQLEKKEDMKKRGQPSPDCGDALALTFAAPVNKVNRYDYDEDYDEPKNTDWSPFDGLLRRK